MTYLRESFQRDRPAEQRAIRGVALRLTSALLLAATFALVKLASTRGVDLVETLFYRQCGSALCATSFVAMGPGFTTLRTRRMWAHVSRMVVGMTGMALNFLSMILLPLAEATAIGFSVPIFATLLAALVLGEPTGKWRWGAIAVGFIGVLVIVQPGSGDLPLVGSGVAVAAALVTASVTIILRRLGATELASTTVFWFAMSSLVPLGLLMVRYAHMHDPVTWAIIVGIAFAGGLGQLALTGSLRLAPVALVMPMDYTSLLWATVMGAWLFGQLPSPWTWAGAPIIVASGLVIVWRERRLTGKSAAIEAIPVLAD